MTSWRAKLKGIFMLFRVLAVMVWACTAGIIATAAVAFDGHEIDWAIFAFVLLMAALVQGYPAHIINEIFDWQSGSDRPETPSGGEPAREKSTRQPLAGGSKVIMASLLTITELWRLFYLTTGLVIALTALVGMARSATLLWFIIPGYLLCIFYTLPPLRFAYRPFLGEYCGGFAGIILLACGAYYAQTFKLPFSILWLALGLGFHYAAIMVFFHYIDFSRDAQASPPKRTSVVYLGLEGSRRYAMLNTLTGAGIFAYLTMAVHPAYILLVAQGILIFYCHYRVQPANNASLVCWGKRMTYGVLLAGLAIGFIAKREFAWMIVVYMIGYWSHKRFGKLHPVAVLAHV